MTTIQRLHECPWPGCTIRVPRWLWGCKPHWYRLPRPLRDRCTTAWHSGSVAEHEQALDAIQRWIVESSHSTEATRR